MQELYNIIKKNVQTTCNILKDIELFPYPLFVIISKDPKDNQIKIMKIDQMKFSLLKQLLTLDSSNSGKLGEIFDMTLSKIKEVQEWDVLAYYFLAPGYMEDDEDIIQQLKQLDSEEIIELIKDDVFNMPKGLTVLIRTINETAALSFDMKTAELLKESFTDKGTNIYENN